MSGDAGWLIWRHAEDYARDEGFDSSFELLVGEIVLGFLREHDQARERGWIAVRGEERLGSVFCMREDDDVAKLRLLYLTPAARGQGVGRHLLETCITFARDAGYGSLRLWTHASHTAACALYERRGFEVTGREQTVSFGAPNEIVSYQLTL